MKKIIISLIAILGLGLAASANNYTIDESAIDAMIENAVEVSPMSVEAGAAGIQDPTIKFGSATETQHPLTCSMYLLHSAGLQLVPERCISVIVCN